MVGLVLLHAARRVLDISGFQGDTAGMKGEFLMRRVDVVVGMTGYRHQLDRVRRFRTRVQDPNASDIDIQDMMWVFFSELLSSRDWIASDDKVPKEKKEVVMDKSFASTPIQYARLHP